MKKLLGVFLHFFFALFALLFLAIAVAPMFEAAVAPVFVVLVAISLALSLAPRLSKVAFDDPVVKLFSSDIQKNLFPANEAYKNSKNDSAFLNGKTVSIPQAGTTPGVTKNPASFPLTAGKRVDSELTYDIDSYATDPIHIQDTEEVVLSYNKRANILEDHVSVLNTRTASELYVNWAPEAALATNQVRTTGGNRDASTAAASGTRKKVVRIDLLKVANLLDRMEVPSTGRVALLSSDMYYDLFELDEFMDASKMGSSASSLLNGAVGRILGFDIFVRSSGVLYTNAGTPEKKAVGAAGAAGDNQASLFWHPSFVRRAEGSVKTYKDIDNPLYLGSVFAAEVRFGGKRSRTDGKGIVALIQAAGA